MAQVLPNFQANWAETTVVQRLNVVLELPDESQIETTNEIIDSSSPDKIRKTIRYRNGITIVLHQNFKQSVFAIEVRCVDSPFWIKGKQIIVPG